MQELREPQPGGSLVAAHLVHLMFILALRFTSAEGSPAGVGWLFALADKQLAAAINGMHSDPAASLDIAVTSRSRLDVAVDLCAKV